ncbi:hypothetical protein C8P68_104202 [Mucilaginibacter yixingensis]|uniref:Ig-like domain-containing protein n=1 Tax=Mucilaginibacter yixingensis TaxID=1295612 RepID=A0A2T5J9K5_9SPHI|nr:hypothetical protein [Mucilaginibacter yixingensis]PTQ96714.1 hypothetical protein C8P68_104202 [Mucilaginibacter yixingensis]
MRSIHLLKIAATLVFAAACFLYSSSANGQTCATPQVRVYANTQQNNTGTLSSVSNASLAVDTDPSTASTLTRTLDVLGILFPSTLTQFLNFSSTVPAGTAVTIKLKSASGLVGLLNTITIQPYTSLQKVGGTWQATNAGQSFSGTSLLGAVNSGGEIELTITPQSAAGVTVPYDGVSISLGGGITLDQNVNVYGAYYTKNVTNGTTTTCSTPVDVLSGIRDGGLPLGISLLNVTTSVTNPRNAIDGDATTFADLTVDLTAAQSEAYHTTVFGAPSQKGDMLKLILQNSTGSLLNLNLLDGFSIQLYNGSQAVGSPITSSSTFLSLSLFSSATNNDKYELDITPPDSYGAFDRVEVSIGGVSTTTLGRNELKIYEVSRTMRTPAITIGSVVTNTGTVCAGSTSTLTVNNAQDCTNYTWYDAATGGNVKGTGTSFTPNAADLSEVNPNNYYVEASRSGCSEVSTRTKATINVNPRPSIVTSTIPGICGGTAVTTLSYSTPVNSPTSYTITWDATAHTAGFADQTDQGLPPSPLSIPVPTTAAAGTYNGTLTVKNANGCVSQTQPVSITVIATPAQPTIATTP